MKVDSAQIVAAFRSIQEFTNQPVQDVIGQSGNQVTINPTVKARIDGAETEQAGIQAQAGLSFLRKLTAQGVPLPTLLAQYSRIVGASCSAIQVSGQSKVHTNLGKALLETDPMRGLASKTREAAKHEIRTFRDKFAQAMSVLPGDSKTAIRQLRDYFTEQKSPEAKHFGAFVCLCVSNGITSTDDILDVASGKKELPSVLGKDAVRSTVAFMQTIGWPFNLSVVDTGDNIYTGWSKTSLAPRTPTQFA